MIEFFSLTIIVALSIISPGPDFAVVVRNSLVYGRASACYTALGIAMANLCHVLINLLGIGVIFTQSEISFRVMKVVAAFYLVYLGFQGLKAKKNEAAAKNINQNTKMIIKAHHGFYTGFVTSVLNPKAFLFLLSFFAVMLSPETPLLHQMAYGFWIAFLAWSWFSLVAWFFTNERMSQQIQAAKHWLERITGGILITIGAKLLSSEIL